MALFFYFFFLPAGRRLQVLRGTGNPLARALHRRVRRTGTGRDDHGRSRDGRRPPDTGPEPGGGPNGHHGGDRSVRPGLQPEPGLVPVRGLGGVRRRGRIHRGPVLGVRDKG